MEDRVPFEASVWATLAIIAWAASAHFHVGNMVVEFAQRHEEWQFDEFLTLIFFLSIAAFITSFCQSRRHIRKLKVAEQEAYTALRRDSLTGLPNRQQFLELAGSALGYAWRSGRKCAVLFIDLDGFKPVNDTHGHAAGDALLIAVGSRLRQTAPRNALAARLGGDEFAILLADTVRDGGSPIVVANHVLADLQKPFRIDDREISINASIGIAIGPESGSRAMDLTDAADRAMYKAKRAGRGTVCVFEEPTAIKESDWVELEQARA